MRINTNTAALNSYNQLKNTNNNLSKSLERLSSGKRINGAADDAAGLAISEKMKGQTRGLEQAQRNSQDGISMIQTAEGALKESHSILQRMRELTVQANNDTNTGDDRAEIQKEIDQLVEELDGIASRTEFNTKNLLDGTMGVQLDTTNDIGNLEGAGLSIDASGGEASTNYEFSLDAGNNELTLTDGSVSQTVSFTDVTAISAGDTANFDSLGVKVDFTADVNLSNGIDSATIDGTSFDTTADSAANFQIGANINQTLSLSINDMSASGLGSTVSMDNIDVEDFDTTSFNDQLTGIDEAIAKVSAERSKLGANQNRLEHTINNLNAAQENLTAAESRISDVDMAKEMMNMSKQQILSQAGTAMMAQANQLPQGVLQLLG